MFNAKLPVGCELSRARLMLQPLSPRICEDHSYRIPTPRHTSLYSHKVRLVPSVVLPAAFRAWRHCFQLSLWFGIVGGRSVLFTQTVCVRLWCWDLVDKAKVLASMQLNIVLTSPMLGTSSFDTCLPSPAFPFQRKMHSRHECWSITIFVAPLSQACLWRRWAPTWLWHVSMRFALVSAWWGQCSWLTSNSLISKICHRITYRQPEYFHDPQVFMISSNVRLCIQVIDPNVFITRLCQRTLSIIYWWMEVHLLITAASSRSSEGLLWGTPPTLSNSWTRQCLCKSFPCCRWNVQ